jgi:hypothetical protein
VDCIIWRFEIQAKSQKREGFTQERSGIVTEMKKKSGKEEIKKHERKAKICRGTFAWINKRKDEYLTR